MRPARIRTSRRPEAPTGGSSAARLSSKFIRRSFAKSATRHSLCSLARGQASAPSATRLSLKGVTPERRRDRDIPITSLRKTSYRSTKLPIGHGARELEDDRTLGASTARNRQRALPHVRAWAEGYRVERLMVVGVHSPEFAFERDIGNVKRAAHDLDLRFPIAQRRFCRLSD